MYEVRMRLLLTTSLCLPLLSYAQPSDEKQLSRLQEEAVTAYNKKQYDKALASFQKMYELDPNPLLLYNIGRCQEALGQKREALTSYQAFLQKVPSDHSNYPKAQKSADALSAELGPLVTEPPPAPSKEALGRRLLAMPPMNYYATSAGFVALGSTFGVISLSNAFKLRSRGEENTFDDSGIFARRMRISAVASDLSFLLAAGTAFYGYQRSRKLTEKSVSLSVSPIGVAFSWEL
jgi:tetratricopeptide (TPR) repeat protein